MSENYTTDYFFNSLEGEKQKNVDGLDHVNDFESNKS